MTTLEATLLMAFPFVALASVVVLIYLNLDRLTEELKRDKSNPKG